MNTDVIHVLEEHGIQPTAQRVAVADYVLRTKEHPSADKVWAVVGENFPAISRATVYNTLNLFVEKGLLRELHLAPDSVLFDSNTERHQSLHR
jgi:Fur family transcriptional regulator, iron response regulator